MTKEDSLEKIFQTVGYMFANYIKVNSENPNQIVGKIKVIEGNRKHKIILTDIF